MPQIHHTIDYIEIPARDLKAATAFYGAAFGWTFNDYGPAYAGIRTADGEGEVGGINATEDTAGPGGPLVLLYSDDLEATAEAVVAAGGAVVRGPYPFPGGRRLHFTDPSGNELGVWSER
ncbi:VOC family protein [Desertihabitans brevis]|uniref:VOC family protein n=1 Tax=Desertihabitans brevis TaxID=2268447 RepID=UPI0018F70A04|nr:VOC family protein [Desertihabitans brevis]